MTNQLIIPFRGLDRNGEPQAAAKCFVYQSGTLVAVTVTDAAGTALTWPVVADINGAFPQMFYNGALQLKALITDADGVLLPGGTIDPVPVVVNVANAANITFTPTDDVPYTNVQTALAAVGTTAATGANLASATVTGTGLAIGTGTLGASATINVRAATNAEAIAGTITTKAVTPASAAAAIQAAMVHATSIATTSGTSIDFTGIPTWAKRVTIMLVDVSTTGVSPILVQIGAGSIDVTAYGSFAQTFDSGSTAVFVAPTASTGFLVGVPSSAAALVRGGMQLVRFSGASNIWMETQTMRMLDAANYTIFGNGAKTLSGTLDRVRLTTTGGTDTFDAGSVNIMWE